MALQQTTVVDLIQVAENGIVMVRQRTDIFDDATPTNILASNYHRTSLTPGQDLTGQPANVVAIANVTWTPEVIAAYKAQQEQAQLTQPTETPIA